MADMPVIIQGGAGEYETAAILAVIDRIIVEEAALRAVPAHRLEPVAWVQAAQPRTIIGPRSDFLGLSRGSGYDDPEGDLG
jgi:hypothetical protein